MAYTSSQNLNDIALLKQSFSVAANPVQHQNLTFETNHITPDGLSATQSGANVGMQAQTLEGGKQDVQANIAQLEQQNAIVANAAIDVMADVVRENRQEFGVSVAALRSHFAGTMPDSMRIAAEAIPSQTMQIAMMAGEYISSRNSDKIPPKVMAEIADKAALKVNTQKPSVIVGAVPPEPMTGESLLSCIEEGIHRPTIQKLEANVNDIETKQTIVTKVQDALEKGEKADTDPGAQKFTYEDAMMNDFSVSAKGLAIPNQSVMTAPTPFDTVHEIDTPEQDLQSKFTPAVSV